MCRIFSKWLKRYVDKFKEEFNTRPELQLVENLQQEMAQLTAQVTELQQRFNQLSALNKSLDNTQMISTPNEAVNFENAERKRAKRMRQMGWPQKRPSLLKQQPKEALVQTVAVPVDTDAAKNEQNIHTDTQKQQTVTTLSDEEFKVERMMLLLDRIYAAEEESQGEPISAEEFLSRYKAGQRDFTGINISGVNLSGQTLTDLNLSRANLKKTNLSKSRLIRLNFCQANLNESNLSGADLALGVNLSEANLRKANLSGANMEQATLIRADLSNANLSKVRFLKANLEFANLNAANLQYSYYDENTIFPTNFDPASAGAYLIAPNATLKNANLAGAVLKNVSLFGANLQGANLSQAKLESVNLTGANLQGANLSQANLESVN
ncbi:MAG: pentapeptide repeat-containing protein [Stigonema ocellatum SAG 48.90 = DSM 106950]|nr:pentapeptide repeat-containing protein [Stigonema ocellatum SAG 48.90 = DSM 106950]